MPSHFAVVEQEGYFIWLIFFTANFPQNLASKNTRFILKAGL